MKKLLCILLAALLLGGCAVIPPPTDEPSQETAISTTMVTEATTATTAEMTVVTTTASTAAVTTTAVPTTQWPATSPTHICPTTTSVTKTQRPTTATSVPTTTEKPPYQITDGRYYDKDGNTVDGVTADGWRYMVYSFGSQTDLYIKAVYEGEPQQGRMTVPAEIVGFPVREVTLAACSTELVVPDTVTTLQLSVRDCDELTDVWLPLGCSFTVDSYTDITSHTELKDGKHILLKRDPSACIPTFHISKDASLDRLGAIQYDRFEKSAVTMAKCLEWQSGTATVIDLSEIDFGLSDSVDPETGEYVPYEVKGYISFE